MTPQQVFECVSSLWGAEVLYKHDNAKCVFFGRDNNRFVVSPMLNEKIEWPSGIEQWPLPEKQWVAIAPNAWKDFHGSMVRTPSGEIGELVGKCDSGLMVSIKAPDGEESIVICKGCEVQQ